MHLYDIYAAFTEVGNLTNNSDFTEFLGNIGLAFLVCKRWCIYYQLLKMKQEKDENLDVESISDTGSSPFHHILN